MNPIHIQNDIYINKIYYSLLSLPKVENTISFCMFMNCNNRAILNSNSFHLNVLSTSFLNCGVNNQYGGAIFSECGSFYSNKLCFELCYSISNHFSCFWIVCTNYLNSSFISTLYCPNDKSKLWNQVVGGSGPIQIHKNHNNSFNKASVDAGTSCSGASIFHSIEFYTSIYHDSGSAIFFYGINPNGNNRFGNIIGCSFSGTYQGAVNLHGAFETISYFYFVNNIGPLTKVVGSGKCTFNNCIFENNKILTETGCQTCNFCVFNTLNNSSFLIIHLNTINCRGKVLISSNVNNFKVYFKYCALIFLL